MSNKVLDKKYFKYKIIDDVANLGDGTNISGINIDKTKWRVSENNIYELSRYIRTPSNLKGTVQVQEFNPATGYVYYDSLKYVVEKANLPIYSRDQLGLMDREELVELCRYYGIDTIHKTDKFLVKYIIDKQKEELSFKKDVEVLVDSKIEESFTDTENTESVKIEKSSKKKK